ncbi:hypothetical protein ACA910_004052 [Epithemia clementina (nom. ined.)]
MGKSSRKHHAIGTDSDASSSAVVSSTSILALVVDVTPLAWGERAVIRTAHDKARAKAGKQSRGPCTLDEMLTAIQAFVAAYTSMERNAVLLIMGVADQEAALLYPRKDSLQQWIDHPESYCPSVHDIPANLLTGVATLLSRAAQKASAKNARQSASTQGTTDGASGAIASGPADKTSRQGAIASAVSRALCLLNRIMVATQAAGGISALHSTHYLQRTEDDGVVALMGSSSKRKKSGGDNDSSPSRSAWSPRILIIQASEDRARDYNAMMNCAFCASQQKVVIDGCFLKTDEPNKPDSSPFLEQVCDLTSGVYLATSGAAQIGGALTEVLISVFLPRIDCRPYLQLPGLNKVDFRARCFETAEMVDLAHVCNQCLSIFAQNPAKNAGPEPRCPTCQARIISSADRRK